MFLIEINVFALVPCFGHSLYAQVRTRSVRRPRLHRPDQDRRLVRPTKEAKQQQQLPRAEQQEHSQQLDVALDSL